MLEASYFNPTQVDSMCSSLVTYASDQVSKSMHPWFTKQLEASESIASSFDYLMMFFDPDAGNCMDFENNPFATVLIPEPFDYFAGCAATTQCGLACSVEIASFESALVQFQQSPQPKVTNTYTTSLFFNDMDEDSDMPMKIVTLVELSECTKICSTALDSCLAVAGLAGNNTIMVKKYCVPRAMGYSVRSEPSEEWTIWGSEEWTTGALDIQFADTFSGDVLVVLRDGVGTDRPGLHAKMQKFTKLSLNTCQPPAKIMLKPR
jgi:hypothetical protein